MKTNPMQQPQTTSTQTTQGGVQQTNTNQASERVSAPVVDFTQYQHRPYDDLPIEEQRIIEEICLQRLDQIKNQNATAFEKEQKNGELLQISMAYTLEAQSAITSSSPITTFADVHPYPNNAEIFGPRENILIAIGNLIGQIKHSDEAAIQKMQIIQQGPMNRKND